MRAAAERRDEQALREIGGGGLATHVAAETVQDDDPEEAKALIATLAVVPEAVQASVLARLRYVCADPSDEPAEPDTVQTPASASDGAASTNSSQKQKIEL